MAYLTRVAAEGFFTGSAYMRPTFRTLSRLAALVGLGILGISSGVWLYFHTQEFTQPIVVDYPIATPLPTVGPPTPTLAPGEPTPTPTGLNSFVELRQDNILLAGVILLLILLLLILLVLLLVSVVRRKQAPVIVQPQNQPVALPIQNRTDSVLNLVVGVVTTVAGAIIGHFWR
jgi:hypothetical protein